MNKIKALAEGTYKKYDTADPFSLCDELGINTFRLKMPDRTNGLYYHIKGKKIILINDALSPAKARFTAAHELGHALLHPDSNSFFLKSKTAFEIGRFERQADFFAVCLLVSPFEERADFSEISPEALSSLTGIEMSAIERYMEQINV